MLDYLKKRPMLIAALGCSMISVCAFYSKSLLLLISIVSSLCFGAAIIRKNTGIIVAAGLMLIMALNCFFTLSKIRNLDNFSSSKVTAEVVFCENTYKSEEFYRSEVEILSCEKLPKGVKLSVWHAPAILENGQILKAEIKINKIAEDYKASYYGKGIYISGSVIDMELTEGKDPVLSAIEGVRKYIKTTLFENMDYDSAATMCALVFGDREYLTNEFYGNVKGAGVAHVMVVSGMHLSILVTLFLKLTERVIYSPVLRALTMFGVVVVLCALCGFTMSVLRAGVTYIIIALGLLLNKPYSGDNALGAAVTIILIFSPFAVFSVAFLLSVLSTFGILAVALPVCRYIESRGLVTGKIKTGIVQPAIISLSALLLTLPVTIYIFGYVSTVSVVSNLLISIPVSVSLGLAVIALILNLLFPFLARLIFFFGEYIVKYINGVINGLGGGKYSTVRIPQIGVYISVVLICGVFWILPACKKRIDMVKLRKMNEKIIRERGRRQKWQSFMKRH